MMSPLSGRQFSWVLAGSLLLFSVITNAEPHTSSNSFRVTPPLDMLYPAESGKNSPALPYQALQDPAISHSSTDSWQYLPLIQKLELNHPFFNPGSGSLVFGQLQNWHFLFDRLFLKTGISGLAIYQDPFQKESLGQGISGDLALGYGFGQRYADINSPHYPVTMLIGITTKYTEQKEIASQQISGSPNHTLFFTPGMEINTKSIHLEAKLELPIARFTPATEPLFERQIRANVGLKYQLQ